MRLVLVRHGETSWNSEGRFQGQGSVGLNERGMEQARAVAKVLPALKPVALYSSPLSRTMQMAEEISRLISLPIVPVRELKELDLGELEGVTGPEMRAHFPHIYRTWREDPSQVLMPGGESLPQLQARGWRAIEGIEARHKDGLAVVVTHNFLIVTVVCHILGIPLSRFHSLRLDLASISVIERTERGWRLVSFNERGHLFADGAGG